MKGGHVIRFYGHEDATALSYPEGTPAGAPSAINAGDVVELGPTTESFVVQGSKPFSMASFMLGGSEQAPDGNACPNHPCFGDPAMSVIAPVESFRQSYLAVAVGSYDLNFADVVLPSEAELMVNGTASEATRTAIGSSGWSVVRLPLGNAGGVHTLRTNHDSGKSVQLTGFGHATSYYMSGGANF